MAFVWKRGSCYCVIYNYVNEHGEKKRKWESGYTYKDALKRKSEIEHEQLNGNFTAPTNITLSEFVDLWLPIQAKSNWQFNTYSASVGCINNHILPYIGKTPLQKLTPYQTEKLISDLYSKKKANHKKNIESDTENVLSSTTIKYIYLLLKQMLDKAVIWGYISKNPVMCKPPKRSEFEQSIWQPEDFVFAIENIQHPLLHLAVHLSFICSLRIGELLAITLDDVNFEDRSIHISKTIQRVRSEALSLLPHHSIVKIFPSKLEKSNSRLILKDPKTKTSCRKVYLTQPLLEEIQERMLRIETAQGFYGWKGDSLLFCLDETGDPIEPNLCEKWFVKWQKKNLSDCSHISFHGIRHSSATYKLILSEGDYKAVQGDTGHKTADMLMNTYAHIQDINRQKLAKKLEQEFYVSK